MTHSDVWPWASKCTHGCIRNSQQLFLNNLRVGHRVTLRALAHNIHLLAAIDHRVLEREETCGFFFSLLLSIIIILAKFHSRRNHDVPLSIGYSLRSVQVALGPYADQGCPYLGERFQVLVWQLELHCLRWLLHLIAVYLFDYVLKLLVFYNFLRHFGNFLILFNPFLILFGKERLLYLLDLRYFLWTIGCIQKVIILMLQQAFDLLNLSKPVNNIPSVIIAEHDRRVCRLKVVWGLCIIPPSAIASLSWAVTQDLSKLAFTLKDLEQALDIIMFLRLYSI